MFSILLIALDVRVVPGNKCEDYIGRNCSSESVKYKLRFQFSTYLISTTFPFLVITRPS